MGNIKVFGHKNPDLDSVAGTVGLAHLLKVRDGVEADMALLGEMNKEAKFVFNKFNLNFNLPIISRVEDGEAVALVDHNEFSQSADNIENAKIKIVLDHHKIDNFRTSEPLEYIARPLGSTSTLLYGILQDIEGGLDNKEVNILLLSAIISDTLLFKSPTTTELDVKVANKLATALDIDINTYGLDLLKAGADLSELSAEELVKIDSKEFDCNRTKN